MARVGEVVAFYGGLQAVAPNGECLAELHVDGLPRAEHVLAVVGDKREAVARVEPRRAERPAVVAEVEDEGCGVEGRVGYGVAVLGVGGRRVVAVALARVVGVGGERELAPLMVVAGGGGESQRLYESEVHHRPAELALHRYGHNLVLDAVVVEVEGEVQMMVAVVGSCVPLRGVFGSQLGVAHKRVVEVVERWCAKDALVEGTHRPRPTMPRCQVHRR